MDIAGGGGGDHHHHQSGLTLTLHPVADLGKIFRRGWAKES
jgi:hypothetical protein